MSGMATLNRCGNEAPVRQGKQSVLWESNIGAGVPLLRLQLCPQSHQRWKSGPIQKSATVPTGMSWRVVFWLGLSLGELPLEIILMSENLTDVREMNISL